MPPQLLHSRRLLLSARLCLAQPPSPCASRNSRPPPRLPQQQWPCAHASTTIPCLRHSYSTARHDVQVQCRSNGEVHLSILRAQHDSALHSPILLFLPPGPLTETSPDHQHLLLHHLQQASNATVVSINYRTARPHRYPTPVHDVLTAYDWVLNTLASQPQHQSPRRPHVARIGVCGELIGGSLAAMLALTECQMSGHRIAAAAVNNPVVDWIFPSDLHQQQDAESENASDYFDVSTALTDGEGPGNKLKKTPAARFSSWDAYAANPALPSSAIAHARNSLFPNPDAYFDRFASPIHFFRTPGMGYITPMKTEDDLASEASEENGLSADVESVIEKRRRVHRIYPPTGVGLKLPLLRVSVGEESVLRDQGEELVRLMRRSVNRDSRSEVEAERRIGLTLRPGVGLWSGPFRALDWREEIEALGAWFGRVLV